MIGARIFKAILGVVGFMLVHAAFHYPDSVLLWDTMDPFSKEGAWLYFIVFSGMFLITNICECRCEKSKE